MQSCKLPEPELGSLDETRPPDFKSLFEAQFSYVWHTLRRLGVAPADLEDLTHDVFLAVYRRLDQYDPARPIEPWLFAFAFRVASDHRRLARVSRERVGIGTEGSDPAPSALDRLLHAEELALAHAALSSIELGKRAVFILHEIDGFSVPEVARAMDIPLNTAYSRLRLARAEFKAALRRRRANEAER